MVEVQEALSRKLMAITGLDIFNKTRKRDYVEAVSYTHLTLPTKA